MPIAAGVFSACLLHEMPSDSTPILPPSSSSSTSTNKSPVKGGFQRFAPATALLLGIMFSSYPEKNADWTFWSRFFQRLGVRIFKSPNEMDREWSSLGALFIMLGTLYCPTAQSVLSHKILVWMGKVSFGVFLLHSMLIRSLLCWMLYYGKQPQKIRKDDGILTFGWLERRQGLTMWAAISLFFTVLYTSAWLWYRYVESWCGRICQKLEDALFEADFSRPA